MTQNSYDSRDTVVAMEKSKLNEPKKIYPYYLKLTKERFCLCEPLSENTLSHGLLQNSAKILWGSSDTVIIFRIHWWKSLVCFFPPPIKGS